MRRRRSGSRRRSGGGILIKLIIFVIIVGSLGWLGVTKYQLWQKIETLPEVKGHDFITSATEVPVLVIAKQSTTPAQLDSLIVLKADFEEREVKALSLPVKLSDGATSIGQYLESNYYKEMQLAIEGQLALPLTGYIVQPRSANPTDAVSLIDSFTLDTPPDWWSTTIGLPLWLNNALPLSTNLSEWQVLQLSWLIRDLNYDDTKLSQIPQEAQIVTDDLLQLIPDKIDPIVQDLYISNAVKSEATSVVVKNATHIDGLAALASRFVANMGGVVVAVEPADTAQTGSSITAEKDSSLTRSVNQFMGIPTTIQPQTGRERADVQLIIGTDALARLGR